MRQVHRLRAASSCWLDEVRRVSQQQLLTSTQHSTCTTALSGDAASYNFGGKLLCWSCCSPSCATRQPQGAMWIHGGALCWQSKTPT